MTPGMRPARRVARAAPFLARSRGSALIVRMSAIALLLLHARAGARCTGFPPAATASRGVARRFFPLRGKLRAGDIPPFDRLIKEARYRALLADALDRLRHQRRDRQLPDVARDAHRLRREDAIGGDERFER